MTLAMLGTTPTEEQINEFIDTYGTHVIRKINMGAKFVTVATFDKAIAEKQFEEGKKLSYSGELSGFGFTAGGSSTSTETEKTTNRSTVSINESDQYTIGTTLPAGDNIKQKLESWAINDAKIMAHPMPIGKMNLVPLVDEI